MIPINELRVCNWVFDRKTGAQRRVAGFQSGLEVGVVYFDRRMNETSGSHMVDPIPLTPEILEKCGFKTYTESSGYKGFVLGNFEVGMTDGEFYYSASNREGYRNEIYVVLLHLHQLQNLYLALTGEELSVGL